MRASKYSPEFRERAVRLARESERPISAVARDLGVCPETTGVWVRHDPDPLPRLRLLVPGDRQVPPPRPQDDRASAGAVGSPRA